MPESKKKRKYHKCGNKIHHFFCQKCQKEQNQKQGTE